MTPRPSLESLIAKWRAKAEQFDAEASADRAPLGQRHTESLEWEASCLRDCAHELEAALSSPRFPQGETDGLVAMQRHRDAWRAYAYGTGAKPTDFLDGNMVDRGSTVVERTESQSILAWAQERYENTLRLSDEKNGEDRDGWLEDAAYWRAIIELIQPSAPLAGTPQLDYCTADQHGLGCDGTRGAKEPSA